MINLLRPRESQAEAAPCIRGLPLVGVIPYLLSRPLDFLLKVASEHPDQVVRLPLGPKTIYYSAAPASVQHVLADSWRHFAKGPMVRRLRPLVGNSLITSETETWIRNRRIMQPVFTSRNMQALTQTMIEVLGKVLDTMPPPSGQAVEIGEEMVQLTLSVILQTMFGASLPRETMQAVRRSLQRAMEPLHLRVLLYFLPERLRLPGDKQLREAVQEIDDIVLGFVRERRRSGERRQDLLSLLLDARDHQTQTGMDDRQLRDELVLLFLAGFETTAQGLTWMWYLLDQNPQCAKKLDAELAEVLGDRRPEPADLQRLVYTRQVFQEALRLRPPVWFLARVAAQDERLGDCPIPQGSTVLLSPYVTHRLPQYWDHPDRFEPERFSPEKSAARHRFAYLPFGAGPRQCIGDQFALIEATLIIAMFARRYRPRLVPGHQVVLHPSSTLRPRYGLQMYLDKPSPRS